MISGTPGDPIREVAASADRPAEPPALLRRLARLHGVLPHHRDGFREDRWPAAETLLAVLRSLGVEAGSSRDLPAAIRRAQLRRWTRLVEPVVVSWEGAAASVSVRLPQERVGAQVQFGLREEGGTVREWSGLAAGPCLRRLAGVHSRRFVACRFPLPDPLPIGYHRLQVCAAGQAGEAVVIRAPRRAAGLPRTWGVFAPLYALHGGRSSGTATWADLGDAIEWVQGLGGGLVGTLPMLAAFLDEPFAPSPYTPASRYFWNEFYLDLPSLPEWRPSFGGLEDTATGRHVDYRASMRIKRSAIERAAANLDGGRRAAFLERVASDAELRSYAGYRAGLERRAARPSRFDPADARCRYHAYAQWAAAQQIEALAARASKGGAGLYLDLPLGVHPLGYDRWRHTELFAAQAAAGAPPDRFFSKGQNWGFAPLNPQAARSRGHDYFIRCVRHHMRQAGVLRLDHLMGLHRLYWIPEGLAGDQGAYVQYPAEELYAIVCLESRRHGTAVVGEDLGTVPASVRRRMAERGFRRTYVAQFELRPDSRAALRQPPQESVASVNTHDTAMFAAYWSGADIEDQAQLGLLTEPHAADLRRRRSALREALLAYLVRRGALTSPTADAGAVLRACCAELSQSNAECVIVSLEDLWGESEPQNTPGTDRERRNWTRRARLSLERIRTAPPVLAALRQVELGRRSSARGCAWTSGPNPSF